MAPMEYVKKPEDENLGSDFLSCDIQVFLFLLTTRRRVVCLMPSYVLHWSRIHERTISLRFLSIIWTNQFQTVQFFFFGGGGSEIRL